MLYDYIYYKDGQTNWQPMFCKSKMQQDRNFVATDGELLRNGWWTFPRKNAAKAELGCNKNGTFIFEMQQNRNIFRPKCKRSGTYYKSATGKEHLYGFRMPSCRPSSLYKQKEFRFCCINTGKYIKKYNALVYVKHKLHICNRLRKLHGKEKPTET